MFAHGGMQWCIYVFFIPKRVFLFDREISDINNVGAEYVSGDKVQSADMMQQTALHAS